MKKRILALAMAGALTLGLLAGCGNDGGTTATPTPAPVGDATPAPTPDANGGGAPDAAASGTFKIGGIGPLTGENAIYGTAAMNGAQIAVDEINALGGAVQFEFQSEDDVADGATSVNAYNTLMDWGMQVLVGPVTSGAAISVAAQAYDERTFCLTPSASSADVTEGRDNMFQVCFTDPNQGIGAAGYLAANMAGSKVAVIYRNDDPYSQGIRDTFAAEAEAKGLAVVYEGTFTADTQTDFSVQLTAAQAAGADVVFLPIYYQPASVILNQANAMGYTPTFFGVDGMDGILTMKGFDTALAEGVMLMTPFNAWGTDTLTADFVAEYERRFSDTPNQFAADGYDCVYAIYAALNAAGATSDMSSEELCEALIGVFTSGSFSVDGLTGTGMTWSARGEVTKTPVVVEIKDGIYVTL